MLPSSSQKLRSPTYLNTSSNIRTVLNTILYIVLLVDLCGRGGDIARHPHRPENMVLPPKLPFPPLTHLFPRASTQRACTLSRPLACWQDKREANFNTMQHYMGMIISIFKQESRQQKAFSLIWSEIRDLKHIPRSWHIQKTLPSFSPSSTVQATLTHSIICELFWMLPSTPHFLIDLCGHDWDIVCHPPQCPKHMCLRWEDVTFYCFN